MSSTPAEMRQVVMNLAKNAIDAMRSCGGRLGISVGVEGARAGAADGRVTLVVADTGPGVDRGLRERVFDPFFTTKPNASGIGMGLAIVKGIVRDRAGSIDVDSDCDTGACFTVSFPLVDPPGSSCANARTCCEAQDRE